MSKTSKRLKEKMRPLVMEAAWAEVQRGRRRGRVSGGLLFLAGVLVGALLAAAVLS